MIVTIMDSYYHTLYTSYTILYTSYSNIILRCKRNTATIFKFFFFVTILVISFTIFVFYPFINLSNYDLTFVNFISLDVLIHIYQLILSNSYFLHHSFVLLISFDETFVSLLSIVIDRIVAWIFQASIIRFSIIFKFYYSSIWMFFNFFFILLLC